MHIGEGFFAVIVLGAAVLGADDAGPSVAPVVPGLHGKHPLTDRQVGAVLMGELRCASCHDGMDRAGMKEAPDLWQAGSRLTAGFLEKFIADPVAIHPGTTMPDTLGGASAEERREVAASISHFLRSLGGGEVPVKVDSEPDAGAGRELFHEVGCVACHSPRDEEGREGSTDGVVSLANLPGKYRAGALEEFLHDPLRVRPSGRMPDMNLTKEEAAALALYLAGPEVPGVSGTPVPTPGQIEAGKSAFRKYNCSACHQVDETAVPGIPSGPPLRELDPSGGCLSPQPGAAPDFHLDEEQRTTIRAAMHQPAVAISSEDRIKMRLTRLNCIACHLRDDYGGVAADRDRFFHSSEEALGNEARIPPPLTLTGAKLRPVWMNKVLFDRESVRPYMKTRMPRYGESALEGLPAMFAEVDHLEEVVLAPPDRQSGPKMRNGAHLLLGTKGLGCIACHNYNGKESPGMKGLDLMTTYQRLQPAWFHRYMKNPAASRPGIIMPSYWPGGTAVQTEILDGDAELQLRALWHNFSLGRSARDPEGLVTSDTRLVVTDRARTYRGRSRIAGFRGIAVGLPGGMNYAFNAQNGTLSGIWTGGFVKVNWRSQGAGDFSPLSRAVELAQDVGFLQSPEPPSVWPVRPQRTKEHPVNPDPLYPRQHGYAFKGYRFDEALVPTFTYHCGDIVITDKIVTAEIDGVTVLRRAFRFSAPSAKTIHFRAMTGPIESSSAAVFETPAIRITITPVETMLRPLNDKEQELLIKLSLPKGESTYTLDYALLR